MKRFLFISDTQKDGSLARGGAEALSAARQMAADLGAELVAGSLYMLCPNVNCYVAFGTNPTAVATNRRLIADREYPFFVPRAGKFSVKRESYDGVLWISKHSLSME